MVLKTVNSVNYWCDCSKWCIRTMQTTWDTSCALSKVFWADIYTIWYCEKTWLRPVVRNSKWEQVFTWDQRDLIVRMKAA